MPIAKGSHFDPLPDDKKRWIVQQIAIYKTNKEIQKEGLKEIGNLIPIRTIENYRFSQKWRPLLQKYRDEYERNIASIPMASRVMRLERIENNYQEVMSDKTMRKKDRLKLAVDYLHEATDMLEPKSKTDKSTNIMMMTQVNQYKDFSDEELKEKQLKLIDEMVKIKKLKEDNEEVIDATE